MYVGRLGLTDQAGQRLLVDWRSPAAEPFFGATHAQPMGLASRRRYRWTGGRVTDYWDEVFTADGLEGHAALDDQSAFVASLGSSRSDRMRDVLATIQADQDAIIRAGSRGALVVDGGPGTGKTVVALHRAAYLLYADPRLGEGRGGVLFVGPHRPYLAYVADVLPSLGEDGVRTCTLRDLLPEGADAPVETDAETLRLKADKRMVEAVERAVALYEEPPTRGMEVETPWGDVWCSADDWTEAFGSAEPGKPHNEVRDEVLEELLTVLADKLETERGAHRRAEASGPGPERGAARRLRQGLDAPRAGRPRGRPVVGAGVPPPLRALADPRRGDGAPAGSTAGVDQRRPADPRRRAAAARRPGLVAAAAQGQRETRARERQEMADVVDHLIAIDDSEMKLMSMLRGDDLQAALVDQASVEVPDPDVLAGPFAHVVVDEAQELTDAEWQMLLLRCPSRSFTVVGDRAQARHGFPEPWRDRLERAGLVDVHEAALTINYRTPEEVMAVAEPVIRAAVPDANVPTSIRASGIPVRYAATADLDAILDAWRAEHPDGVGCVIGLPSYAGSERVRSLTPELAKGLEFDLVVLVEPDAMAPVDRYVAMTRSTQELVVLSGS